MVMVGGKALTMLMCLVQPINGIGCRRRGRTWKFSRGMGIKPKGEIWEYPRRGFDEVVDSLVP
jgi:hypothetical protein